jgi:hypothetical protein
MRQDPLGNRGGIRRRGIHWWVLVAFALYAGWYWFSNRTTDALTGEKVLIDKSISPISSACDSCLRAYGSARP